MAQIDRGSDFDVAILGESDDIRDKIFELINDMTNALERDVDLSTINRGDPLFKFQIAKNCILLYGKKCDLINFKTRVALEYMDNRMFFDLEYQYIKNKLKTYV